MSTLLDPAARTARGVHLHAELTGAGAPEPVTLLDASWRDYVYAEVWSRPGLDLRSRCLIAMASAAGAQDQPSTARYVHIALHRQEISLAELREAALHVAVYNGWSAGTVLDAAITQVATAMGLSGADFAPIRGEAWDPEVRHEEGMANFNTVMCFDGPPPRTAYFEGGIINFVFGEMWMRPGLDQRARRWLTLVGVANSSSSIPIRSHIWSAMASGNATAGEMFEFVLQYAIHSGWPKASVIQTAVFEQSDRVAKNLPFEP